jgi:outer membrane receptor protein involved in Fe transport
MYKFALLVNIILISLFTLNGQKEIKGTIIDYKGLPVAFANIVLSEKNDLTKVIGTYTDEKGNFNFKNLPSTSYNFEASMIGYETFQKSVEIKNNEVVEMEPITFIESTTTLGTVEINARKQLFERQLGKVVFNVKNMPTLAGTTILDLLERSPGIILNRQNGNLSMSGKDGVNVLINGRMQYIKGEALLNLLQGMNSNNLEKIELISNPSAKYDAEGNAGLINIVTSKSEADGLSGNYAASIGGNKGALFNSSINLNYNVGKLSIYSDLSTSYNSQSQQIDFVQQLTIGSDKIRTITFDERLPKVYNGNARFGAEYGLKNTKVYAMLTTYSNKWTMNATSEFERFKNLQSQNTITSVKDEINHWKHLGLFAGIQHTFKNKGVVDFSFDNLQYGNSQPTEYLNSSLITVEDIDFYNQIRTNKNTPLNINVFKLDYNIPIKDKLKVELGAKLTKSDFINEQLVEYNINKNWEKDDLYSSYVEYDETIYAAYSTLQIDLGAKTNIQAGLRYEKTISVLEDIEGKPLTDRNYGQFFPNILLNRKLTENSSIGLAYTNRVTRPTFKDLAPFIYFTDPYSFTTGNANLKASTSSALKLEWKIKAILWSLQYTNENDPIAIFIPEVVEGSIKTIYKTQNLENSKVYNFNFSMPFAITKWWSAMANVGLTNQAVKTTYQGNDISANLSNVNVFVAQNFNITKSLFIEQSNLYSSGSILGAFVTKPFGAVNIAIKKSFKNGSSLILGGDNIFNTMIFKNKFSDEVKQNYFDMSLLFSRPTIKLTYSNSFGGNKPKASSRTRTSDERQRID